MFGRGSPTPSIPCPSPAASRALTNSRCPPTGWIATGVPELHAWSGMVPGLGYPAGC